MNPTFVEVKTMRSRITLALAVSVFALAPSLAKAGPPLLCFPMSIGNAPSLPWGGDGWKSPLASYDRTRLADDTVALLASQPRTLVRMETLRRAVIYASSDESATKKLFIALRARAKATTKSADANALFDLGYAVEAFRQTRHELTLTRPVDPPEDGYALIRQALEARGPDPEIEYAAALVTMSSRISRGVSDEHLRAAIAGAKQDPDLARTIAAHEPLWGSKVAALNGKGR